MVQTVRSLPPHRAADSQVLAGCGRDGTVIAHCGGFPAVVGALSLAEREACVRAFRDRKIGSVLRARPDGHGTSLIITYLPVALINPDACDQAMADMLARSDAPILMIASGPQTYRDRLFVALAIYGLSKRQAMIVGALVATGSVRRAALVTGIGYDAARTAIVAAREKTGSATINELIHHVTALAMNSAPASPDQSDAVCKAMGLTPRQYAIACALETNETRAEVAAALGLSEAVVAAALKEASLRLGVSGATEIARIVYEARIAARYARTTPPIAPGALPAPGSARTLARAAGGSIGYSDYGPASGRPVFILHSTITTRHPPMALVAALQASGFRPLTIDRPGFGDTDPVAATARRDYQPWHAAAHDLAQVCAALGLASIDVIARGCGHAAVIAHAEYPALIARAVLVNPTPAKNHTKADIGPLGAIKRRYANAPWAIGPLLRLLSVFLSPSRMRDGMRRSFKASPPDLAALDDPAFIADYFEAISSLGERTEGYIAEQRAWANGAALPVLPQLGNWRLLFGDHFVLHDPVQAAQFWRSVLPATPAIRCPEAGQMLAYTHPQHVIAALIER